MSDLSKEDQRNLALARQFEQQSRNLEPDEDRRRELLHHVNEYTHRFLNAVQEQPGFTETEDLGAELEHYPIGETSHNIQSLLGLYERCVDHPGSHPTSPAHLAYIPATSNFYSALGDYLAAVSNRYSGTFFAGPGAVRMENRVLEWLRDLVGLPSGAEGNLTSGGSIANLTAIVTARESHGLEPATLNRHTIYLSEHTHHSVAKALHLAGLGTVTQRLIPVDANNRMMTQALRKQIAADLKQGCSPWMVAATAGTTNLGSIDPLAEIAAIAQDFGLWFHVDAAYGGFFLLSDLVRDRFAGIEQADSVILDPHKSLFIPFGTGAVLVRDGHKLRRAHQHTADYMQDAIGDEAIGDPADLGPELTRHFRALRIWMPLMLLGTQPFAASLSEKIVLSRYAYSRLSRTEQIEVGPSPDLSIFVFRYRPRQGDIDQFNRRLVDAMKRDGRVFFSSTVVDGQFMVRFPLLSFRTHTETVDKAIDLTLQTAHALEEAAACTT